MRKADQRKDISFRKTEAEKQHHRRRSQSEEQRRTVKADDRKRKLLFKRHNTIEKLATREDLMAEIIANFRSKCNNTPTNECTICYRHMFKHQVSPFHFPKQCEKNKKKCDILAVASKGTLWICFTCQRYTNKGNIPPQAVINGLKLQQLTKMFKKLNNLERHLVSPVIPFMKILPLPKTLMKGIHGPCVCVPSKISTTTNILPRNLSDSSLLKVKLKRKLAYKGHHLYQTVDPALLQSVARSLKNTHPAFAGM